MDRIPQSTRLPLAIAAAGLIAFVSAFVIELPAPFSLLFICGAPFLLIGGGVAALTAARQERAKGASALAGAAIAVGVLVVLGIAALIAIVASFLWIFAEGLGLS